mmetsp:Transcript_52238/g.167465  ORF Transcript_52238/g.167465 Transcript_52238/m.167465 type:complete len:255 (-) Transcript_52238:585-1349(-)
MAVDLQLAQGPQQVGWRVWQRRFALVHVYDLTPPVLRCESPVLLPRQGHRATSWRLEIADPLQEGGLADATGPHDTSHLSGLQLQLGMEGPRTSHETLKIQGEHAGSVLRRSLRPCLDPQLHWTDGAVLPSARGEQWLGLARLGRRSRFSPPSLAVEELGDLDARLGHNVLRVVAAFGIEEGSDCEEADEDHGGKGATRDEEGDGDLVLCCLHGRGPAEDLASHHAGDGHEADDVHAVDRGNQSRLHSLHEAWP